ncbi:MAG: hydroxyethylthiazole kinase [Firmicutes bacterium]|nr:hydroxyethylthiazole kinase [Bacillota bacterium]
MYEEIIAEVRKKKPVIHCITNYVTVNDVANIVLACGASPVMADAPEDAADIASLADGLVLNLGTLNQSKLEAMLIAGRRANEKGIPIVLDPVGAGASQARTQAALRLLKELKIAVVRGNSSEIRTLALGHSGSRGVDAAFDDAVTEGSLEAAAALAKDFSLASGAVVAMTGAIDVIAGSGRAAAIYNGSPLMRSITGAGCMLSGLTAAFAAAAPDRLFEAAASAVASMGICGELAHERMGGPDGNASFRNYLIDAVFNLKAAQIKELIKIKEL